VDGEPVVRNRVRVTMSCDHRVIDGAVGAKFLQTLRRLIENPLMLVY
jgi:pyruvate dehydrogenase E2 component (dihydrolipoamide acetyltransferase)